VAKRTLKTRRRRRRNQTPTRIPSRESEATRRTRYSGIWTRSVIAQEL